MSLSPIINIHTYKADVCMSLCPSLSHIHTTPVEGLHSNGMNDSAIDSHSLIRLPEKRNV